VGSGDLAGGWDEVVVEVEDTMVTMAFVAMTREEAGGEATAAAGL